MNIGALIPIRLNSERLPKKSLMTIKGKTMLEHLVERALGSKYLRKENIVVCTTENKEDDLLIKEVERLGIRYFRGSEDDIIDRFKCAVDYFGFDYVVQIDGDDPFSEPLYMDLCMDSLLENSELDIVYCEGLPLGTATKAIKCEAINRVWEHHMSNKNDTGFIWYFTKTGLCRVKVLKPISENHINDKVRLTLDYNEDFEFFEKIFDRLYSPGTVFALEDIVNLLKRQPELMEINSNLNEQYWQRTFEKVKLEYKDDQGNVKKVEV